MKWVDYREKLGIGFSDQKKLDAFKNKLYSLCYEIDDLAYYGRLNIKNFHAYYSMVGERPQGSHYESAKQVHFSIFTSNDWRSIISKCTAFINTAEYCSDNGSFPSLIKTSILSYLDDINAPYSIIEDDDGIFIFPKGVPEFDDALVSAPLDWLKDYPRTEKAWSKALRAYSEVTPKTASDVADLFRKSLETFFQEFFNTGDGRTLENCKSDYGKYLKDNGVPGEVSNNLETLLQAYTNYMSNYAKHTDKAKVNVQEYLMYQTGNVIRLVISLKQEESV